jgi:hypothetical protein
MSEIAADNHGVAVGSFTVPGGVPAGTVLMEIVGDQGTTGTATYTANGTITTEARRIVNTVLTRKEMFCTDRRCVI